MAPSHTETLAKAERATAGPDSNILNIKTTMQQTQFGTGSRTSVGLYPQLNQQDALNAGGSVLSAHSRSKIVLLHHSLQQTEDD